MWRGLSSVTVSGISHSTTDVEHTRSEKAEDASEVTGCGL